MLQTAQLLHNRYRLDRPFSQTAGRETWLATDTQTQDRVVVKLLAFSDAVQWDRVRLFEREAAILRQLQHDRIPQYRDQFCLDDRLLWFGLVHEYIPGRSLKDELIDRRKIAEQEAQAIAISVLEILDYLHSLNPSVLHRDIKPSNLIRGEDNQIYLIDFGTVQDRLAKEGATFTVVGTYGYVPLEQLGGRAVPASDLYALGATLMHFLTGISPADLPSEDDRSQLFSNLSLAFRRWLLRMTDPNCDRRFTTAKAALTTLKSTQTAGKITQLQTLKGQIQLQRTPQKLTIKLPPMLRRPIWLLLLLVGIIVGITTFPPDIDLPDSDNSGWLFIGLWAIGCYSVLPLSIIWLLILPEAIATHIIIDANKFEIRYRLLGILIHQVRGKTSEIDRIYPTAIPGRKRRFGIGISAGVREYRLSSAGLKLSAEECQKITVEIADWLGLSEEANDAAS